MKISSIRNQSFSQSNNSSIRFKSSPAPLLERCGYADSNVERYAEALRKHLLGKSMELLYEGRKSEHEMKQYLDKLLPPIVRKPETLSEGDLKVFASYGITKLRGTKNSYKGPYQYHDIDLLKPLLLTPFKVCNLSEIILDNTINDMLEPYDIESVVNFIKIMQEDNAYIGCDFGIDRTNFALMVNYYYNPLSDKTWKPPLDGGIAELHSILDFIDYFTPEQKESMKWTKEFETNLKKKLNEDVEHYITTYYNNF